MMAAATSITNTRRMARTSDTEGCTVQEAAQQTGLSVHTLRYYERAGLLAPIERVRTSRHRRYTALDLRALEFIKRMRATAMPIHQLQRYMSLMREGEHTSEERREMLEAHRGAVCAHIAALQDHLTVIEYKIANYERLRLENGLEHHADAHVCTMPHPQATQHSKDNTQ